MTRGLCCCSFRNEPNVGEVFSLGRPGPENCALVAEQLINKGGVTPDTFCETDPDEVKP